MLSHSIHPILSSFLLSLLFSLLLLSPLTHAHSLLLQLSSTVPSSLHLLLSPPFPSLIHSITNIFSLTFISIYSSSIPPFSSSPSSPLLRSFSLPFLLLLSPKRITQQKTYGSIERKWRLFFYIHNPVWNRFLVRAIITVVCLLPYKWSTGRVTKSLRGSAISTRIVACCFVRNHREYSIWLYRISSECYTYV